MKYLGQVQDLSWASPSRIFATTAELFDSQPNYEHEVAIALDTGIKYQGAMPVVGGWCFATGEPVPPVPPSPPPVNDQFTKLLLEFDGVEGSRTYPDTNGANWPRKWTQLTGMGHITNKDDLFGGGSLFMDGYTIITAPDEKRFAFNNDDFTIRGYFKCDFPIGELRTLYAKTDHIPFKKMFWFDRLETGEVQVWTGTDGPVELAIQERDTELTLPQSTLIRDRNDDYIFIRYQPEMGMNTTVALQSVTKFSDTLNTGWHSFKHVRNGNMIRLVIDDVEEDSQAIGSTLGVEMVQATFGVLTIGAYGPPDPHGSYLGGRLPWRGGFDRFAVDIGVGR
jgi:hypothetical protein